MSDRSFTVVGPDSFEVIGANDTSGDRAPGGSWLAHWEKHTGRGAGTCIFLGCGDSAAYGGHLHVKGRRLHFIGPVCAHHNSAVYDWIPRTEYHQTKANTKLVSRSPR